MATIDIPSRISLAAFSFSSITSECAAGPSSFSTSPSHRLPLEDLQCDIPTKRLRSCLSPTRNRTYDGSSPLSQSAQPGSSPMASRSGSFSSADSSASAWGRKQVRWPGEETGCVVASYHQTWSASEYDRTPLDPPSEGERACIMPARNSRCLSPLELFSSSERGRAGRLPSLEADSDDDDDGCGPEEDNSPRSLESIILTTPPSEDEASEEGDSDGCGSGDQEDREWEECMERRRMMFAQMAARRHMGDSLCAEPASSTTGGIGGLDGYTSLSATLAELLQSVSRSGGGPSTPQMEEDDDDEDSEEGGQTPVLPKLPIGRSGLRTECTGSLDMFRSSRRYGDDEDEDEDEEEEEDREPTQRFSSPLETPELDDLAETSSDIESALTSPLDIYPSYHPRSALQISLQT